MLDAEVVVVDAGADEGDFRLDAVGVDSSMTVVPGEGYLSEEEVAPRDKKGVSKPKRIHLN